MKSFAFNDLLKSTTHRHHQMLFFLPWDALQHLYCSCCQFRLCLYFGFSNWKACSVRLRSGDWLGHWNIPFLCLQKDFCLFLGVFCSTIWVIIHMYCEALSNQLCSICLNLSRELSPLHLGIHPAASISSQLINKHQWSGSTGSHMYTCCHIASTMLGRYVLCDVICFGSWAVLLLPHTFVFPSLWFKFIMVLLVQRFCFRAAQAVLDVFWQGLIWSYCSWV